MTSQKRLWIVLILRSSHRVGNPDPPSVQNPPDDPNRPADLDLRDLPGPLVKIVMLYRTTRDWEWTNGVEEIVLLATALQAFVNATRTRCTSISTNDYYRRELVNKVSFKNFYLVTLCTCHILQSLIFFRPRWYGTSWVKNSTQIIRMISSFVFEVFLWETRQSHRNSNTANRSNTSFPNHAVIVKDKHAITPNGGLVLTWYRDATT